MKRLAYILLILLVPALAYAYVVGTPSNMVPGNWQAFAVDPGAPDSGVTSTAHVTLKNLVTAIGTTKKSTIVFPHTGSGTTTQYTIGTALDLSSYSNITFQIENGAQLKVSTGVSGVTLPGPANMSAQPNQQIMSGTSLYFGSTTITREIPLRWFGINSSALSRALSSGCSNTISIDGEFTIEATGVTVPSGSRLVGKGSAIFKHEGTANYPILTLESDIVVENITFYGVATSFTGAGGDMVASDYQCIRINGDRNTVRNCEFKDIDSYGIYINDGDSNLITQNRIKNSSAPAAATRGRYGIGIAGGKYNTVSENILENLCTSICSVKVDGSYAAYISNLNHNKIVNNTISNMSEHGIYVSSGSYETISGNKINNVYGLGIRLRALWSLVSNNVIDTSGSLEGDTTGGIGISEPTSYSICDSNVITTKYVGIYCGGEAIGTFKTAQGFDASYVMGYNTISNNKMYCNDISDSAGRTAIRFLTTLAADQDYIRKNVIINNFAHGFNTGIFGRYFEEVDIIGNSFYSKGNYVASYYGIGLYFSQTYSDVRIINNIFDNFPNRGIYLADTPGDNFSIIGNSVSGCSSWGIQIIGSPTNVSMKNNRINAVVSGGTIYLSGTTNISGEQSSFNIGSIGSSGTSEFSIFTSSRPCKIIDVLLINSETITQNDTNYEIFTIFDKGKDGTSGNTIVSVDTRTTNGVLFSANKPTSLGASSISIDSDSTIEEKVTITLKKTPGGSGQGTQHMTGIIKYVEY